MRDPAAVLVACHELIEALGVARVARARARLERQLQKAMTKAFRAQGKAFLKEFEALKARFPDEATEAHRLSEALEDHDWGPLFDRVSKRVFKLFTGPIDKATRQALRSGAEEVIVDAGSGISFDLKHPTAAKWLKGRAAKQVAGINEETRSQLGTIITKGAKEGWGYNRIAQAITEKFAQFAEGKPQKHIDSRAHLIAITEIGDAFSEGQLVASADLAALGLEMEKAWSTIGDDRVSEGCKENEEAGWIPNGDEFPSGHQRPLRFPGCRCLLRTRRKGARK